jgi:hypothetical protein
MMSLLLLLPQVPATRTCPDTLVPLLPHNLQLLLLLFLPLLLLLLLLLLLQVP